MRSNLMPSSGRGFRQEKTNVMNREMEVGSVLRRPLKCPRPGWGTLLVHLDLVRATIRRSDEGGDGELLRYPPLDKERVPLMNLPVERLLVELIPNAPTRRAKEDPARLLIETIDEPSVARLLARLAERGIFTEQLVRYRPPSPFPKLDRVSSSRLVDREYITIVEEI